jgi:hypothetical protein
MDIAFFELVVQIELEFDRDLTKAISILHKFMSVKIFAKWTL